MEGDGEDIEKALKTLANLSRHTNSRPSTSRGESRETSATAEVLAAAGKCMSALQMSRKGKRSAKDEVSRLFKKSKAGGGTTQRWKHRFVCLASRNITRIPTTDHEKEELYLAGLGEKEVDFDDISINSVQFRETLYEHFPRLRDGGGYQFLKCGANSRLLEVLSSSTLSSPELLKNRIGNARTYIRPLQVDLDTSPVLDRPSANELQEKCLKCGEMYALEDLPAHIESCGLFLASDNKVKIDLTTPSPTHSMSEDEFPAVSFQSATSLEQVHVDAYESRNEDIPVYESGHDTITLEGHIAELNKKLTAETLTIVVRRQFVLIDALKEAKKPKFSPMKRLKIQFVGESGIDEGGLTKEFFSLLINEISEKYFCGKTKKFLRNDTMAVQNREFYHLGQFFVLSVLYGSTGFPFLARPVFDYLLHKSYAISSFAYSDVPDGPLKLLIEKMYEAETDDRLRLIFTEDEALDLLSQTGYRKPLVRITLCDRSNIKSVMMDFHLISKCRTELDQFSQGLQLFGFLDTVKQNPAIWERYFIFNSDSTLTPESIRGLLTVNFHLSIQTTVQQRN